MKKVLHSLRNQPDHIKSRYVIIFAIVATVLTVLVWLFVMQLIKKNDDTIKTESPFKIFQGIFSTAISETKEKYTNQKTISPESIPTPDQENTPEPNNQPIVSEGGVE